jgi:hypothetical protein
MVCGPDVKDISPVATSTPMLSPITTNNYDHYLAKSHQPPTQGRYTSRALPPKAHLHQLHSTIGSEENEPFTLDLSNNKGNRKRKSVFGRRRSI